jgi:hypothetical protein
MARAKERPDFRHIDPTFHQSTHERDCCFADLMTIVDYQNQSECYSLSP